MSYNDLFGYFDVKNFEIMAREYEKKSKNNIEILQNNSKNTDKFLYEFENFLTLLITFYKENLYSNMTFFEDKIQVKKADLKELISKFCMLYKGIKKDYFFTSFSCKIINDFDIKNKLKNCLENLLILSPKYLQISEQKELINLSFCLLEIL